MAQASQRAQVLQMYKMLLKLGSRYPSVKRPQIVGEIKRGFRDHRNEADPKKIEIYTEHARQAIRQMAQYVNLDPRNPNWSVDLEKAPFGSSKR